MPKYCVSLFRWREILLGMLASLVVLFLSGVPRSEAQLPATIEIYRVKIRHVCGTPTYSSPPNCRIFSADDFDTLKKTGRLLRVYQTSVIPPLVNKFSSDLIRDSRVYGDFADNKTEAALLVINWPGAPPSRVKVVREDIEGNQLDLDGPFQRRIGPGRFFYHFPFEQVGQLVLTIEASPPKRQIIYSP